MDIEYLYIVEETGKDAYGGKAFFDCFINKHEAMIRFELYATKHMERCDQCATKFKSDGYTIGPDDAYWICPITNANFRMVKTKCDFTQQTEPVLELSALNIN